MLFGINADCCVFLAGVGPILALATWTKYFSRPADTVRHINRPQLVAIHSSQNIHCLDRLKSVMDNLTRRPGSQPEATESPRIALPGFGLPLKEMPEYREKGGKGDRTYLRLPHAIADWCGSSGVTVYERRMLGLVSQITDKPNWDEKVFDETIVDKWWQEAQAKNEGGDEEDDDGENEDVQTEDTYFSKRMFDYVSPFLPY